MPPPCKEEDDDAEDIEEKRQAETLELPRPPEPPHGRWKPLSFGAVGALGYMNRSFDDLMNPSRLLAPALHDFSRREIDPNPFLLQAQATHVPAILVQFGMSAMATW